MLYSPAYDGSASSSLWVFDNSLISGPSTEENMKNASFKWCPNKIVGRAAHYNLQPYQVDALWGGTMVLVPCASPAT
jgi:hypothetical protein